MHVKEQAYAKDRLRMSCQDTRAGQDPLTGQHAPRSGAMPRSRCPSAQAAAPQHPADLPCLPRQAPSGTPGSQDAAPCTLTLEPRGDTAGNAALGEKLLEHGRGASFLRKIAF